jgi:hypothetical protein
VIDVDGSRDLTGFQALAAQRFLGQYHPPKPAPGSIVAALVRIAALPIVLPRVFPATAASTSHGEVRARLIGASSGCRIGHCSLLLPETC